jgi:hypothetical protein
VRRGRPPSKKNTPHEKNEHKPHSAFSMSTSHWPPLPVPSTSEEGKKLVAGYPGDFTKYNKDQFISIICALSNNNPSPKFEGESPALLENGQIHSDLEILKPIPNGASVEFIEAKQKSKSKGNKNPTKNDSPGSQPTGTTAGDTQKSHAEIKESSDTPIIINPTPTIPTPIPNQPATVWPAIDSSSVKTPPPPNHQQQIKKPPPPKHRKPVNTAPSTPNEKSQQQPHNKGPQTAQKSNKDQSGLGQQQATGGKSKHYPVKHQKKPAAPEGHSGSTPNPKSDQHHGQQQTKSEKENVVQSASSGSKEAANPVTTTTTSQSLPKEKSDRSYADIARSTTPTNTPSNTAVSD